jgi:hypothetical protein
VAHDTICPLCGTIAFHGLADTVSRGMLMIIAKGLPEHLADDEIQSAGLPSALRTTRALAIGNFRLWSSIRSGLPLASRPHRAKSSSSRTSPAKRSSSKGKKSRRKQPEKVCVEAVFCHIDFSSLLLHYSNWDGGGGVEPHRAKRFWGINPSPSTG